MASAGVHGHRGSHYRRASATPSHNIAMPAPRLASALVGGVLAVLAQGAFAQPAVDRIEQRYRADKAACERRTGAQEDVCEERAKGRRDVALAELDYRRDPSRENAERRDHARIKARYEVEKEKCDRLTGREENRCERRAEATYDRETAAMERRYRR